MPHTEGWSETVMSGLTRMEACHGYICIGVCKRLEVTQLVARSTSDALEGLRCSTGMRWEVH